MSTTVLQSTRPTHSEENRSVSTPRVRCMEASSPATSSATDSTEPRPENGVATDASGAARRSRRRRAPPTTVSSTVERRSTRSLRCASRASVYRRSPESNGWPGTPSPAGSSGPAPCAVDLATGGPQASPWRRLQADEIRSFTGGKRRPTWVFAAIEVGSRLWTSTVVDAAATGTPWHSFATCVADDVHHLSRDRDRWLRVLRDGDPSGLRSCGALRAGDQDASP